MILGILTEKMAKFRGLGIIQQSIIAGALFFAAYALYLRFVMSWAVNTAIVDALSATVLFTAVYYMTSMIALRMRMQDQKLQHAKGPRKGRRGS